MSHENVEIARAMLEDFLAGATEYDADGVLTRFPGEEVWDAEIVLDFSGAPMPDASGVFKGIEACRGFWHEWLGAWDALEYEYEVIDAGDRVVALINNQRMRGRSTGIEMPAGVDYAHVLTFREGRVVHWKIHLSQAKALEAVGLPEHDAHADS
jgi:ketosteroid isomerase-like protein